MKDFLYIRNGCWIKLKEGDFLSAPDVVDHMLSKKFTNVAIAESWRYQVCPKCATVAPRPQLHALA
jgi:hypothetical protein